MDAFFDAPDICNAHLRAARDNSVLYALYTTYSILGAKPKFTRLEYPASPLPPGAPLNTPAGTIDWRARTITLAGDTRSIDALKRHSGRTPSARAWRWPAHTREYDVDVDGGLGGSGRWTAVPTGADAPVASFMPALPHLFRVSAPAGMQMAASVPPEDVLLLVLVFIYSEMRRRIRARGRRIPVVLLRMQMDPSSAPASVGMGM